MPSSDDDHNCPICLESIFQQPDATDDADGNGNGSSNNNNHNIGATVPCGHLYHYDCFGSWQASRPYGAVKCPTCNVKTENFVRLYLDIGWWVMEVKDNLMLDVGCECCLDFTGSKTVLVFMIATSPKKL